MLDKTRLPRLLHAIGRSRNLPKHVAQRQLRGNAPMKSFFAVLKTECFHNRKFASIEEWEAEIHGYIRCRNDERLSLKLKKLSPVAYRTQFATAACKMIDSTA